MKKYNLSTKIFQKNSSNQLFTCVSLIDKYVKEKDKNIIRIEKLKLVSGNEVGVEFEPPDGRNLLIKHECYNFLDDNFREELVYTFCIISGELHSSRYEVTVILKSENKRLNIDAFCLCLSGDKQIRTTQKKNDIKNNEKMESHPPGLKNDKKSNKTKKNKEVDYKNSLGKEKSPTLIINKKNNIASEILISEEFLANEDDVIANIEVDDNVNYKIDDKFFAIKKNKLILKKKAQFFKKNEHTIIISILNKSSGDLILEKTVHFKRDNFISEQKKKVKIGTMFSNEPYIFLTGDFSLGSYEYIKIIELTKVGRLFFNNSVVKIGCKISYHDILIGRFKFLIESKDKNKKPMFLFKVFDGTNISDSYVFKFNIKI